LAQAPGLHQRQRRAMPAATTAAKVLMAVAATGCMVGGIWYLELASKEEFEHKAIVYRKAVEAWPAARAEFEGLDVRARVLNESLVLPKNLTADRLHDAESENLLPSYRPLAYRASGVPQGFLPVAEIDAMEPATRRQANPQAGQLPSSTGSEYWAKAVAFELDLAGSRLSTEVLPLVRALVHHEPEGLYNHCKQKNGVRIGNGECRVYSYLARVCAQVERGSHGEWRLAPRVSGRNNSYGCGEYADGDWAVPVYKPLRASHLPEDVLMLSGSVNLKHLVVEVRSRADPFLTALEVTRGSLDFGLTAEEERTLGLVLIIFGLVLCLPPGCAFFANWRKRRKLNAARYPAPRRRRPKPDSETIGMRYAVERYGVDDSHHDAD